MIVNRIGDFGLALGLFALYNVFQTLDYGVLFSLSPIFSEESFIVFGIDFNLLDVIVFFIFIGAVGKSAQLGLHT